MIAGRSLVEWICHTLTDLRLSSLVYHSLGDPWTNS